MTMISKRNIIFSLVQYQHDIIFALLLRSSNSSYKITTFLTSGFSAKNANFKFSENTFAFSSLYDVIFRTTFNTNDVIKVDFTQVQYSTIVIKL